MTESKKNLKQEWVDPDDAPDLSAGDYFDRADWYHGNVLIRRGRPKSDDPKVSTTLRLDADVIKKFRDMGPGWQTKINAALREWLEKSG